MAMLFVRHEVQDFTVLRVAFDAERKTMGVNGDGVCRSVDDSSEVTVYHDFDSADTAQSFADSAGMKEVMSGVGVLGVPDVWITESA